MKIDESVAKLKTGDLVRSIPQGWIGTIVGFEEARSRLYSGEKGLLPIVYWSYPEEDRWRGDFPWRCHPNSFEVISESR
tara:strand:+ start:712 stop:948 length:237 start_codon:yes stop_codon:yes gene_type:complete